MRHMEKDSWVGDVFDTVTESVSPTLLIGACSHHLQPLSHEMFEYSRFPLEFKNGKKCLLVPGLLALSAGSDIRCSIEGTTVYPLQ